MGVAYYPSFERQIPGFDPSTAVSGKSTARSMKQLDGICVRLGMASLMSFYSESNEEAFGKIGEPVPPGMQDDPIQWSEPAEGLRTVVGLIEYLRTHAGELPDTARIQEDLEDFRKVLIKAQEHGTRFRLRIDV